MFLFLKPIWHILSSRVSIVLLIILLIGAFLRFERFGELTRFNNDQVRDIKLVEAMHLGTWPSFGPLAGGTDFKLGPSFYHLEYLSSLFFGQDPVGTTLFIPLLSTLSIILFYLLFRIYFTLPLTLVLTGLYATSFYLIKYARFGWNPNVIPCILLAFLLVLLRLADSSDKRPWHWYILIGLLMGMGMQLHTLMLLLMPTLLMFTLAYRFFETKNFDWKKLLLTIGIILIFFLPVLASELETNWDNTHSFFSGTNTKTGASLSLFTNLLETGALFAQGNTYVLSGYEPERNWLRPLRLIRSGETGEITLFGFGMFLTLGGVALLVRALRSERSPIKKRFLFLLSTLAITSLFLFLPIGEELNIRFFIILFPVSFLLLGLLLQYWLTKSSLHPFLSWGILSIVCGTLFFFNLKSYTEIYNFTHPRSFTGAYGGISLGETRTLSSFLLQEAKRKNEPSVAIAPFEFDRSLEYFLAQEHIALTTIKDTAPETTARFLILWKDSKEKALTPYVARFHVQEVTSVGRFRVFSLELR